MPFKSDKQRKWMYANKPGMAKEWSAKEKGHTYANALRGKKTPTSGGVIGGSSS